MTTQSQDIRNSRQRASVVNSARRGFTLIELMVVIVIIAVLVGIITPAVMSAMRQARIAEVTAEISKIETAISSFKTEFGGISPPSSITIPATSARDRAIIRRLWPQFDFTTNGGNPTLSGTLNGAECLVFFLGGLRSSPTGPLVGFSKDPAQPFKLGGNRVGPFFDFDMDRVESTGGDPNAPEYKDPLPGQSQPYLYLSSYDGRGYRLSEVVGLSTQHYVLNDNGTPADLTDDPPYKPNSHQIISPGSDGQYGSGGVYDSKNYTVASGNAADADNITNFRGGRLVP